MDMSNSLDGIENLEEAAKLLTFIDRQVIDDEDPATKGGHHVSHETDVQMIVQLKPNKF